MFFTRLFLVFHSFNFLVVSGSRQQQRFLHSEYLKNDKQRLAKTIIALPLLVNNHYENAIRELEIENHHSRHCGAGRNPVFSGCLEDLYAFNNTSFVAN